MDQIFLITKDTSTKSPPTELLAEFAFDRPDRHEYIISKYNLQTEEDNKLHQARIEMMKNITSKQAALQSSPASPDSPIFNQLCDPEKYRKDPKCFISGKTDGLTNWYAWLTSPFCGRVVHKSCLERERKNPKNSSQFVKICDVCHKDYVERQAHYPYWKNSQKLKILVDDREAKHYQLAEKVSKIEAELVNIKNLVTAPNPERLERVRLGAALLQVRGRAARAHERDGEDHRRHRRPHQKAHPNRQRDHRA
jgi:hypothetical protein